MGPHKQLPPAVKYDGRMGEFKNFRHVIYYPPDGRYTTDKLEVRKMAGRDPVTGRKVIQQVEGGSKQKARWIDWRRWPVGRDPEDDLVERIIHIRYDPMRKPMIALTGITFYRLYFSLLISLEPAHRVLVKKKDQFSKKNITK